MNYRHGFHAGNFADVLKHAVFLACLDDFVTCPEPFTVIDTHAGAGVYDLSGAEAQKTGEWRDGVGRLLREPDVPPFAARYLAAVKAAQTPGFESVMLYPGSPRLSLQVLRPEDHYIGAELHPNSADLLSIALQHRKSATVLRDDGYGVLLKCAQKPPKRGLVLVDPPFEAGNEFERLAKTLKSAYDLWDTGTFLAWYPVKDVRSVQRFEAEIASAMIPNVLAAYLTVRADGERMRACCMMMINPPRGLFADLSDVLPWLASVLAQGAGANSSLDWLGDRHQR
jgi:23S rRNA (adenine2030-N6)-methyltransferase